MHDSMPCDTHWVCHVQRAHQRTMSSPGSATTTGRYIVRCSSTHAVRNFHHRMNCAWPNVSGTVLGKHGPPLRTHLTPGKHDKYRHSCLCPSLLPHLSLS